MSKIKLVIECEEQTYAECKRISGLSETAYVIANGTPITEGDLISRSELIKTVEKGEGISWEHHNKDDMCVRKKYIDNAPAVVERPKGDTTDSCDMNFFEPEKHMRGDENGKS